jgi:putative transposase
MARLPRLSLAGLPHHLIQRGHNRQPIFLDAADYVQMHALLVEQARLDGVAVHAYVLMPNHFHLLATPTEADSLARMMQGVGRRYVRYFNARAGRSGTLWDGRYRCAPLEPSAFVLPCMVYLDLHPVREGLAEAPAAYAWSSHAHFAGLASDRLVTPHQRVWQLGNTPFARESAYVARVEQGVPPETARALRDSAMHGWALGDEAFMASLQKQTGRRLTRGRPGRPKLPADSTD